MASRKGMVLESGKDWAIVLLPSGEYKKIKTSRFLEVGELYQYREGSPFRYAAAAVLFLAVIFTTLDYFSVQAYAQFDSLQMGVNRWGRVISVHPTDYEGQSILDTVNKNDTLDVAVEKIYNEALVNQPVETETAQKPVLSVTTTDEGNKKLEQKMLQKIDNGLQRALQGNEQNNKKGNQQKNIEKPEDKPGVDKGAENKNKESERMDGSHVE